MKKIAFLVAAALLLSSSCSKATGGKDNPYKSLDLTTKSVEFAQKGNAFSLEFIDRVNASTEKDYIISPLSMQFLLGMILDGARGETADEICQVLGYGKGEVADVNAFCLSMLRQLPQLDKKTTLTIANAIFVDDGWPLLESYKADVSRYYDAAVSNLDFSNGEASLRTINGWCSDHTNGLVPKILDEVSTDILAYLLNALYFKSQWVSKFSKDATSEEPFTTAGGAKKTVKMMKVEKSLAYRENDVYKAVNLPYGNGAFTMTAFLPQAGHSLSEVTAALKKETDIRPHMNCEVDLWLPKFETSFHIDLNELLSEMGMPKAFDGKAADFTGMSEYALCLSFVRQDAVIKVDEEGAEAAAVSSAGMFKTTAVAPGDYVIFHANQPFLYVITETSTGAVLFAGRYGAN